MLGPAILRILEPLKADVCTPVQPHSSFQGVAGNCYFAPGNKDATNLTKVHGKPGTFSGHLVRSTAGTGTRRLLGHGCK